MFCPRIKLSNSHTLILDGVETGIFLSDFAQQLRRKNADVPDSYFTLLDAAGISPTLILNQYAKTEERGYPFSMRMHSKSTQRELANLKKTSSVKFQDEVWLLLLKKHLEAKKKRSLVIKRITTNSSPVTNHLS